ncbi:hypothetical protein D3C84_1171600 [compost metagenome]
MIKVSTNSMEPMAAIWPPRALRADSSSPEKALRSAPPPNMAMRTKARPTAVVLRLKPLPAKLKCAPGNRWTNKIAGASTARKPR